jgi:AraC-like DNA-binding protein
MPAEEVSPVPAGDPYRVEFETTEAERGLEYLASAYGNGLRIRSRDERFRLHHVRTGPGPFYIDTVEQTVSVDYQAPPPQALVGLRMRSGVRTRLDINDRLGPGDIGLNGQPDEPYPVRYESTVITLIQIDRAVVAEAALNAPDESLGPLRFHSLRAMDGPAARRWSRTVDYIIDTFVPDPSALAHPLVVGGTARMLAVAMLTSFPNTWITQPLPRDRIDATPAALSRAIDFIERNTDVNITATDIARAARVTVRAVQLAFRRHLDTTPMAYLRMLRLGRAHEQLLAADPADGTTVRQIAARWGYANLSRFAADYRRTYGQPPSRTLRRH